MSENEQLSNVELITNDTFERLKSKNNRRKFINGVLYVSIFIGLCALFIGICVVIFFKVETIDVTGSTIYNELLIIEASGIELEQNIYSLNERQIEESIVMNYPYIKGVKIIRHLPSTIELSLTIDTPYYYTLFIDEYFVLSNDLRVLERSEDFSRIMELRVNYDIIEIKTPSIKYSVVGREIVFKRGSDFDFVKNTMQVFESTGIYAEINKINLSNKYDIYIIYNNRYKIIFGNSDDLSTKITWALGIIEEHMSDEDQRNQRERGTIEAYDIKIGSFEGNNQLILE